MKKLRFSSKKPFAATPKPVNVIKTTHGVPMSRVFRARPLAASPREGGPTDDLAVKDKPYLAESILGRRRRMGVGPFLEKSLLW